MILTSHNLTRYGSVHEDTVIRINLAWVQSLNDLKSQLSIISNSIFLDLPIGRTKPPNNSYDTNQIKELISEYPQINYLAISNVESSSHVKKYIDIFGDFLTIVPKIETKKAIDNIAEIVGILQQEKLLMLDHDDLFTDMVRQKLNPSKFFEYIDSLVEFCQKKSVKLLRMRGVIFSDEDKYYYKK